MSSGCVSGTDRRAWAGSCSHPAGCHTGDLPVLASATVGARFWLLIEHSGPWASHLEDCRLPEEIHALIRRAQNLGIRPQLIRRPGHRKPVTGGIHVMVADATAPEPWIAEGVIAGPSDLDMDALVAGVVPESCILVSEPVFLVCTHAKRNACCARIGLPLARSLAEVLPDRIWETSHVGGDRYAANLVCLPHGLYYGSMSQAAAIAAVDAYRSGEVILDRFRGRAGIPEPSQAAEHFVRAHTASSRSVSGRGVLQVGRRHHRSPRARWRRSFPGGGRAHDAHNAMWYGLRRDGHHLSAVTLDRLTPVRYATPALA